MAKRHPLHSICPYFAMFPEAFVERHVLAYSNPGDVIFDPFSGRGTTVFQSLLMGREAAGTDINPVAACVSGAKADAPGLLEVLGRIDQLQEAYEPSEPTGSNEFFDWCFHKNTLPQITYLRSSLDWRSSRADRFIAAMSLGALHGESHKTKLCFSNRMPRTISTKPDYSVRWWKERGLIAPERDAFAILKELAKFRLAMEAPESKGSVVLADARNAGEVHPEISGKVKLVVTSPPYVNVTDYAEDQWLRLWFLGGEDHPRPKSYADDRHTKVDKYWNFLREVWSGMKPLLMADSKIVVRIGGKVELDELEAGLLQSLRDGLSGFGVAPWGDVNTSELRKRQTNAFRPGTRAGVEHDFIFQISREECTSPRPLANVGAE